MDSLDNLLGFQLYKAFSKLKGVVFTRFYETGHKTNFEQWIVLNRLAEFPGVTQSELLHKVLQSKGNLARTIMTLEKEGMVRKQPDPLDARSQHLFLTKKGSGTLVELRNQAKEVLARAFRGFDQRQINQTMDLLQKLMQNLED